MAISAVLEISEPGSVLQSVQGALLNSYTVIDLDYTLKRGMDITARPSTVVYIDMIKISIRAPKEFTTPFHNWIMESDKVMDGVIKIYDSSGVLSSSVQGVTGGNVPVDFDIVNDMATDTVGDLMDYGMDEASDYGGKEGDIFDEMSKEDLMKYIDSKNMDITVDKGDTAETLRKKIRYYKKIDAMSLSDMKSQAQAKGLSVTISDDMTEEQKMAAYKKALRNWNNKDTSNKTKTKNMAKQGYEKAADKAKQATTQTATSTIGSVARALESARSISFKHAYCVSLREHFCNRPDGGEKLDASYPWIIELGIKPASIEVQGANVMSLAGPAAAKFEFFKG